MKDNLCFFQSRSFDGVIGWCGHNWYGNGTLQSTLTSCLLLLPFCFFSMSSVKSSFNFFASISAFASIAIGELNNRSESCCLNPTTSISWYLIYTVYPTTKNLLNFNQLFLRPCLRSILFFKNVFQSPVKRPRLWIIIFSAAKTENYDSVNYDSVCRNSFQRFSFDLHVFIFLYVALKLFQLMLSIRLDNTSKTTIESRYRHLSFKINSFHDDATQPK